MRKTVILTILAGLLLLLVACGSGPFQPAPTAIPLAATATSSADPGHMRAAATATAANPTSTLQAPAPTATTNPGSLTQWDDQLAERTARSFVDRLSTSRVNSAFSLYLTDRAQESTNVELLAQLDRTDSQLVGATLLEFRRATASSYEGRVLLRWEGTGETPTATQTMTLRLAYERGLWLIDSIALGEPRAVAPTPTRKPAASSGQRTAQLEGKLVFQASSGGDIFVINADGSGFRRLTDGLDPAWSPDGRQIAFTRWRNPWGIYLLDASGSGEERVVDGIRLKEVAWSPDGSRIAFTINYGSDEPIEICFFGFCFTIPPFSFGQIWVANLATGELLSLPLDDRTVHAPTWSPVQDRIVFAGEKGLAWIDLETMATGKFSGGSVWDGSPGFSPDGRQIAFMSRVHDHWELFAMNADGSGRRQLTHSNTRQEEPPSNVAPAWSPDGTHIAFLSNRDGPWRIYVMRVDGSQQRPMFGAQIDGLAVRYEWASERAISWRR